MTKKSRLPWFKDGLNFTCTGCGKCCTGSPGYVFLRDEEIDCIANHLQLTRSDFLRKYTKYVGGRYSLIDIPPSYDCIFLKDKKCQIYELRPQQCRTFPWWKSALASLEAWEKTKTECEGIDHLDARHYSLDEILAQIDDEP